MKDKNKLQRLITSLTVAERGYVTKNLRCAAGGDKIYLELFGFLVKNINVTDDELSKKIPNLKYNKHYLFNRILDALSDYHKNSTEEISINNSMNRLEVLYKKNLIKDFKFLLSKIKSDCYTYGNFTALLKVLKMERKFINSQSYNDFNIDELQSNHLEYESALERVKNLNDYRFLAKKLFFIIKKKEPIRTEKDFDELYEIMSHPLLTFEERALTVDAKMSYCKSNYFYRIIRKEYEDAFEYSKNLVALFRSHPQKIKSSPGDYLTVLTNHLLLCIATKKFADYSGLITYYETLILSGRIGQKSAKNAEIRMMDIKLNYHLKAFEFEEAEKLIEKTRSYFEENEYKDCLSVLSVYSFNIAYFYLLANKPDKSLKYIHFVLNNSGNSDSQNLYFTRIFLLIAHYELRNFALLECLVKSTYKYLLKRNRIFKFENLVLKFIRNSYRLVDGEDPEEFLSNMHFLLKKLNNEPFQSSYKEIFNFEAWLKSKIDGVTFAATLKETELKGQKINTLPYVSTDKITRYG